MTNDKQCSSPDFESFPCGMRVNAAKGAQYGTAIGAAYEWETYFPHRDRAPKVKQSWALKGFGKSAFRSNAVAQAARKRGNPYDMTAAQAPDAIALNDVGRVTVRRKDDLTTVAGLEQSLTTMQATTAVRNRSDRSNLQLVGTGV